MAEQTWNRRRYEQRKPGRLPLVTQRVGILSVGLARIGEAALIHLFKLIRFLADEMYLSDSRRLARRSQPKPPRATIRAAAPP